LGTVFEAVRTMTPRVTIQQEFTPDAAPEILAAGLDTAAPICDARGTYLIGEPRRSSKASFSPFYERRGV
jgi:hypothetical protein